MNMAEFEHEIESLRLQLQQREQELTAMTKRAKEATEYGRIQHGLRMIAETKASRAQSRIAELEAELRTGNKLCAALTDKCRVFEELLRDLTDEGSRRDD